MTKLRTTLILLVSVLFASNILVGLLPPNVGLGKRIDNALLAPRTSTGTLQRWHMFQSIPMLRDMKVRIVTRDDAGVEQTFGAVLPGFKDFETRKRIRNYYAFVRMFNGSPGVRDAYFDRIAAELRGAVHPFVEFTVEVESEFTRLLSLIRHDGVLSKTKTETYGPFPVEQHADAG